MSRARWHAATNSDTQDNECNGKTWADAFVLHESATVEASRKTRFKARLTAGLNKVNQQLVRMRWASSKFCSGHAGCAREYTASTDEMHCTLQGLQSNTASNNNRKESPIGLTDFGAIVCALAWCSSRLHSVASKPPACHSMGSRTTGCAHAPLVFVYFTGAKKMDIKQLYPI